MRTSLSRTNILGLEHVELKKKVELLEYAKNSQLQTGNYLLKEVASLKQVSKWLIIADAVSIVGILAGGIVWLLKSLT